MDEIKVGEVFTVGDETENVISVEVLAKVTLDRTNYVAASLLEDIQKDNEDDIEVFFLKVDDDRDLIDIESNEEYYKVSKAFDVIFEEV